MIKERSKRGGEGGGASFCRGTNSPPESCWFVCSMCATRRRQVDGLRMTDLGFRVYGLGSMVWDLGFRVFEVGFKV